MMRLSGNRSVVRIRDNPSKQVEIVSCPAVLHRYLSAEFAREFLNSGRIRVMSLEHYRDTLDVVRGDTNEGEKRHKVPNGVVDGGELGPALYIGGPVRSEDNIVTFSPPPSYCLCLSTIASRELAQRFRDRTYEHEPPAVCVRISKPENFLNEIDRAFRTAVLACRLRVVRSFAAPVRYKKGSMTDWAKAQVPYDVRLIKDHTKAVEAEYRIVWSVEAASDAQAGQALQPVHLTLTECRHDLIIVEATELPDCVMPGVRLID